MNDARLDELLTEVRSRLRFRTAERGDGAAHCLPMERMRALTLDPERQTAHEQAHIAKCRRCARLLASFAQEMPHLPLWSLLRRRLGRLTDEEQRVVAYHLEEGGCLRCRTRDERLERTVGQWVSIAEPLALPHPAAAGATSATLEMVARSRDQSLVIELIEEGRRITLEVRTKQVALNLHLVGYVLRGARREKQGYLVLRPDVEGWYTAHTTFDEGELYFGLNGKCEEVLVAPVCIDVLTDEEREALVASAARSRHDPAAWAGWKAWVVEAAQRSESVSDPTWRTLCEVRELIAALPSPQGD